MEQQTKAILVVSFGTSHEDTRKKTIEKIEKRIGAAYPECRIYRAWTSGMIRRKIEKRDGLHIDSVEEALQRMKADGIRQVTVQPTHVISGIENDKMLEEIRKVEADFDEIRIGEPLLASEQDMAEVVGILKNRWNALSDEEVLVLMGHGSEHEANQIYTELNESLNRADCRNILVGTVEASPTVEDVIEDAGRLHPKKIYLTPFMIVAGDHAKNDMAGEEDDSWRSRFRKKGYEVECQVSGLGEMSEIQEMFVRHVGEAK